MSQYVILDMDPLELGPELQFPEIFQLFHKAVCKHFSSWTRALSDEFEKCDEGDNLVQQAWHFNMIENPTKWILEFADIPYEPHSNAISGNLPIVPAQAAWLEKTIWTAVHDHKNGIAVDWWHKLPAPLGLHTAHALAMAAEIAPHMCCQNLKQ